jgi:hypothetical protein
LAGKDQTFLGSPLPVVIPKAGPVRVLVRVRGMAAISDPVFYDAGLEPGRTAYYRVRAVDAWGNQSPASASVYGEY